ncbi:hypothetical protein C1H46_013974 [Malus baccata]|uniref:Uncharacterized protein n=1 Tax=Malus baccata TaxID=106549 RepID=A0A540MNN0_MALBA|nr:hypothetical protein C1H46_013974 [Malus baccata]
MSYLIRSRKAVTTTSRSIPPPSTSATTAPTEIDHRLVNLVGPWVSQAPASSSSSVALPVSARHGHCPPSPARLTRHRYPLMMPQGHNKDSLMNDHAKKNTRGPCRQLKTAKVTQVTNGRITIRYNDQYQAAPTAEQHSALAHDIGHVIQTYCPMQWKSWKVMPDKMNYNFDDINDNMLAYVNRIFTERYKQWKSNMHQYFETFDDPQGGSKFLKIDVFGDVYVRPGDELVESLHATMMEKRQLVLQESASQLPLKTPIEYVDPPEDQREPRASSSMQSKGEVTALTAEVAGLRTELASYKSQMSLIVHALSQSNIRLTDFHPPLMSDPTRACLELCAFDL